MRVSVHRVECCATLVSLFECVGSNTDTFNSVSSSHFDIEVSTHNLNVLLFGIREFLN